MTEQTSLAGNLEASVPSRGSNDGYSIKGRCDGIADGDDEDGDLYRDRDGKEESSGVISKTEDEARRLRTIMKELAPWMMNGSKC